jgi:hypothetical protein
VTDVESKIEDEATPELIATHYLSSVDDMVEHLRAASLLGLGIRVSSYLESDDDSGTFTERWELDLLTSSPVHEDAAQEETAQENDTE